MKIYRLILSVIISFSLLIWKSSPVNALPPLPSGFYGTVTVNGAIVPVDLPITAWINGIQYAITYTLKYGSDSVYSISVPGDDPSTAGIIEGGTEGQTIVFKIDQLSANQTGTWHGASNVSLNLSATGYCIFLPLIER
jgi:hypothetical protein